MRFFLCLAICLLPFYSSAQANSAFERKSLFQAYLSGNLLQTALYVEFIKAQCKSHLPPDAPLLKTDYEITAYQTIKKYAVDAVVLDVTKQMREKALKNASFETLLIPGLLGKEWCIAATHEHITIFSSISSVLRKSADL